MVEGRRETAKVLSDRDRDVLIAVGLLAGFVLLYVLSNLTAAGQSWENWLLRAHHNDGMFPALLGREIPFPPFDSDLPTVIVGTLVAVAMATVTRRWRVLIMVAIVPGAVLLATQLFKDAFGRPALVGAVLDTDVSYPSGHAAIVLGVSAALLLALPTRWLVWAAPVLAGWSALTTAALQSVGYHRPSEVLGTGLLLPALVLLLAQVVGLRGGGRSRTPARAMLPTVLIVVIAAIAGAWNDLPWAIGLYSLVATGSSLLMVVTCFRLRDRDRHRVVPASGSRTRPHLEAMER